MDQQNHGVGKPARPVPGAELTFTKEREEEILGKIRSKYEESMSPYHAAARLWLDAIIDPLDGLARGRHPGPDPGWISMGFEASQLACRRHGQASDEGVQHGGLADISCSGVPLAKPRVALSARSPRRRRLRATRCDRSREAPHRSQGIFVLWVPRISDSDEVRSVVVAFGALRITASIPRSRSYEVV